MVKVFTYGVLQKSQSASDFGMTNKMYKGKGTLYRFKRGGLCHIYLTNDSEESVIGDIWDVPDKLEQQLYNFEARFGYERVNCMILDESGKFHKCIVYLVNWR